MITFSIKRVKRANLPEIRFGKEFWDEAARVVEASTLENILSQKTTDGGSIKRNARETRERKRRKGRPRLSLVDEHHRFVKGRRRSWKIRKYLPRGSGVVIHGATADLRKIVGYVTKKGYVGWLGLHPDGVRAVRALIVREVKKMFRQAAAKGLR